MATVLLKDIGPHRTASYTDPIPPCASSRTMRKRDVSTISSKASSRSESAIRTPCRQDFPDSIPGVPKALPRIPRITRIFFPGLFLRVIREIRGGFFIWCGRSPVHEIVQLVQLIGGEPPHSKRS